MNILLDTNIIIDLNDFSKPMNSQVAEMQRLIDRLNHNIFIHPVQVQDFLRDKNEQRKKINISRLEQYNHISSPPLPTAEDISNLKWTANSENDQIDNALLFALKMGAVHLLITNDLGLLRKARRSNLLDRVHRLEQFLAFLNKELGEPFNIPLGIEEKYVYELKPQSVFWESLQKSYSGFEAWLQKVAREHRKTWCICDNGEPLAVCIYKDEQNQKISDEEVILHGKILKLCTFKVSETLRGRKLGERLLYTAFCYAIKNNYEYIYTHTHDQDKLIELCCDFGFYDFGRYNGDIVLLKKMKPPLNGRGEAENSLDYAKLYYPYFLDDEKIQKFIIPIKPNYHEELFPDIANMADGLFAKEFVLGTPHSNTIKKAYICHAKIKKIRAGDILLFYRTNDRRSIEVIGVVEEVMFSKDYAETAALVSKRTVYSSAQLTDLLSKKILIILFRMIKYVAPIPHECFKKVGIKEPIQTIREISSTSYQKMIKETK